MAESIKIQRPALQCFEKGHALSSLPAIVQHILSVRGVRDETDTDMSFSHLIPLDQMAGLSQAVDILFDALTTRKKILIVGDFDVDGATSTVVALKGLKSMGFEHLDFLVPNRFEFGYGLSPEIVEVALQKKPDIIITVDNGISSVEGVQLANQNGIQVIVTDHHLPGKTLPAAAAIINPNQPACQFPSKNLAGVGVVFYLLLGLRSFLRDKHYFKKDRFQENNIDEPKLADLLDLVALGTVADVVPLDLNNRRLVYQGIGRIRAGRGCAGIQALLQVGKKQFATIRSSDLGFALGPRINAAGRLESMSLGIECLMTDDFNQALAIAKKLDSLNEERKTIELGMKEEALSILSSLDEFNSDEASADNMPWVLCLFEEDWHQGVIGIVASRLKEKFHRPCMIFAPDDTNRDMIKGSCRSIEGVHIRDLLDTLAAQNPGLIAKFGGHAMAAGLSIRKDDFDQFKTQLAPLSKSLMSEDMLQAYVAVDGELQAEQFEMSFAEKLAELGPWGQKFSEPMFEGEFEIINQRIVGEKHLKLVLQPPESGGMIDAIAFNVDLATWPNRAAKAKVIYKLDINEFRGKQSVQLMVEHVFPC